MRSRRRQHRQHNHHHHSNAKWCVILSKTRRDHHNGEHTLLMATHSSHCGIYPQWNLHVLIEVLFLGTGARKRVCDDAPFTHTHSAAARQARRVEVQTFAYDLVVSVCTRSCVPQCVRVCTYSHSSMVPITNCATLLHSGSKICSLCT